MGKIVFLDTDTIGEVKSVSGFSTFGEYRAYDNTSANDTASRIEDAEVVITNKVYIGPSEMNAAPNLKLICVAATGVNNIDMEYAREKGISVMNVRGYSTQSVAQSTFAMLFYLVHNLAYYDHYVKSGAYAKSPIFTCHDRPYWTLNQKTYGIIGLGNIGQKVAEMAGAFGANVVYYSTSGKNNNSTYKRLTLNELMEQSDVVSIHCPLNKDTQNLLTYDMLRLMKPSAYLLNLGRGGVVNEHDLANVLDDNIIAGAGIDVLENEPIDAGNPLLQISNPEKLLITPHIAWASAEARELLVQKILENIKAFYSGAAK